MKITSRGQVTIPREIREKTGLLPHAEVEFVVDGDTVRLQLVGSPDQSRGKRLIAHQRGRSRVRLSTEELLALTRGEE